MQQKHRDMTKVDKEETVWCDVKLTENDRLLIGWIYRSPNSSISNDAKINKSLIHANNIGFSHVLIMGDFNHPSINWYDSTSPPDVDHPSTRILEAVRDSFMSQHVTEPTHYRGNCTPNTLDLIDTNEEGMVENIKYMAPVGKSHHTSLCFSFWCYTRSTSNRESSYKYHKGDVDNMRKTVIAKDWEAMFQGRSLDRVSVGMLSRKRYAVCPRSLFPSTTLAEWQERVN